MTASYSHIMTSILEKFLKIYNLLAELIRSILNADKIVLLGDFNARVE